MQFLKFLLLVICLAVTASLTAQQAATHCKAKQDVPACVKAADSFKSKANCQDVLPAKLVSMENGTTKASVTTCDPKDCPPWCKLICPLICTDGQKVASAKSVQCAPATQPVPGSPSALAERYKR